MVRYDRLEDLSEWINEGEMDRLLSSVWELIRIDLNRMDALDEMN